MGDETEFQKAYQDHRDEKQEARRLQGLVARLLTERTEHEAAVEDQVQVIKADHDAWVANGIEERDRELGRLAETTERLTKEIAEAEASLEAIRKRTFKRTESLFSLLNDDLRQQ